MLNMYKYLSDYSPINAPSALFSSFTSVGLPIACLDSAFHNTLPNVLLFQIFPKVEAGTSFAVSCSDLLWFAFFFALIFGKRKKKVIKELIKMYLIIVKPLFPVNGLFEVFYVVSEKPS